MFRGGGVGSGIEPLMQLTGDNPQVTTSQGGAGHSLVEINVEYGLLTTPAECQDV